MSLFCFGNSVKDSDLRLAFRVLRGWDKPAPSDWKLVIVHGHNSRSHLRFRLEAGVSLMSPFDADTGPLVLKSA
jgi:hypothetical protein